MTEEKLMERLVVAFERYATAAERSATATERIAAVSGSPARSGAGKRGET